MPDQTLMQMIYRRRVRSGLYVLAAVIVLAKPVWASIFAGLALCAVGLLIRGWASGHIKKEKELAISGPYQYTRNPLYFGNFILGLSVAVGTNSWWCGGLFAAYFLVFYPAIIKEERERMKRLFPEEYEKYKKTVPLFFPSFKPLRSARGLKFDRTLYLKNREYRALYGSAVVWAVLIAKMLVAR